MKPEKILDLHRTSKGSPLQQHRPNTRLRIYVRGEFRKIQIQKNVTFFKHTFI
jgi:hypothetical protein